MVNMNFPLVRFHWGLEDSSGIEVIGLGLGTQFSPQMNSPLMENSIGYIFKAYVVRFYLAAFYQGNYRLE